MKSGVVRETGQKLTNTDMAYRAGYLDARQDSANAYNANKKNNKKYSNFRRRKKSKWRLFKYIQKKR